MSKTNSKGFIQHHFLGAKSGAGFTIIELLVVIAIIGLISSVVLVSMRGSTGKAKIAKGLEFSQTIMNTIGHDAVGVWTFDEGTDNTCPGGKDACDKSGYRNHGTFVGNTHFVSGEENTPHWFADRGEGKSALKLDGSGDYVNCGNSSSLKVASGDMTVEAWVNLATSKSHHSILSKWIPWIFFVSHNKMSFYISSSVGDTSVRSNTSLSIGKWYHIVAIHTSSDNKVQFYLNGKPDGHKTLSRVMRADGGSSFRIGGYGNPSTMLNGKIDEARIYERALSSSEIQQHYAVGVEKHNLASK